MLYLRVAIEAVDLFLSDMFIVNQLDIGILLCSVHMAEIAFVRGCDAVASCDLHVALVAFVPRLQSRFMREGLSLIRDRLRRRRMA